MLAAGISGVPELPPGVIAFPTRDANVVCAICLEPPTNQLMLPSCSHVYCRRCINYWHRLSTDATCPCCRADLPKSTDQLLNESKTLLMRGKLVLCDLMSTQEENRLLPAN
jgi:hypothetical protein